MRIWVFIYRYRGRRSGVQGYPQLLSKFKANMGCLRRSLKSQTKPQANNKRVVKGGGVSDSGKNELTSSRNAVEDEKDLVSKNEGKQY